MDHSSPDPSVHKFSRQEYWSAQPFLSPGDLANPGIKLASPALQTDSLLSRAPGKSGDGKVITEYTHSLNSFLTNCSSVQGKNSMLKSGEMRDDLVCVFNI